MRRALVLFLIGCGATPAPVVETPPLDADHDGIVDARDACPCEPEDADGWHDDDGCPDWDDDGDHVPDACDACPREAETSNGVCDGDGCPDAESTLEGAAVHLLERVEFAPGSAVVAPEASPVLDDVVRAFNGDPRLGPLHVLGQIDAHEPHREGLALARAQAVVAALVQRGVDAARMIAEVDGSFVTSDPHTLPRYVRFEVPQPRTLPSCPASTCTWTPPPAVCGAPSAIDRDDDGVDDAHDVCPCTAEDHDGWQDGDGCPDPDNDGDHIVDACDLCPNEPETYQGNCDEDGCPDRGRICIDGAEIRIIQFIRFDRGSATPLPESIALIDEVARTMNETPQITLVAVLGESDRREPRHATLPLARAQAVVDALLARGVAADRLVAEAGTYVHPPSDPPEASRRVQLEVRRSSAMPEASPRCGPAACEVPVCQPPPPTPPAC